MSEAPAAPSAAAAVAENPYSITSKDREVGKNLVRIKDDLINVKKEMTAKRKEYTEKYPFTLASTKEKGFKAVMTMLSVERDLVELALTVVKLDAIVSETEYYEEDLIDILSYLGWCDQILKLHRDHCDTITAEVAKILNQNEERFKASQRVLKAKLKCTVEEHKDEEVIGKNLEGHFICKKCIT